MYRLERNAICSGSDHFSNSVSGDRGELTQVGLQIRRVLVEPRIVHPSVLDECTKDLAEESVGVIEAGGRQGTRRSPEEDGPEQPRKKQ